MTGEPAAPPTSARPSLARTRGGQLAQLIERRIRTDGWSAGRLIGSEAALCEEFGVGTAVVREAARILEARGIAAARRGPGGGLFVLEPDESVVADATRRYLSHVGVERSDLFDVWMALEQVAISKLATNIDADGAMRLRELLDREQTALPESWNQLPNIHFEIARLSGNTACELFIRALSELTLHTYGKNTEPRHSLTWLHEQHIGLVEATIAGDAALAHMFLRRFIDAVKRDDFSPVKERKDA